MSDDSIKDLLILQHSLNLDLIAYPDRAYRGSNRRFRDELEFIQRATRDAKLIMPILYLEEPQATLLPKIDVLLEEEFQSFGLIYRGGRERTLYQIADKIMAKDIWLHISNVTRNYTIEEKRLGKIHLVPLVLGDTLSQWIMPYRPDRKPPDATNFLRTVFFISIYSCVWSPFVFFFLKRLFFVKKF